MKQVTNVSSFCSRTHLSQRHLHLPREHVILVLLAMSGTIFYSTKKQSPFSLLCCISASFNRLNFEIVVVSVGEIEGIIWLPVQYFTSFTNTQTISPCCKKNQPGMIGNNKSFLIIKKLGLSRKKRSVLWLNKIIS